MAEKRASIPSYEYVVTLGNRWNVTTNECYMNKTSASTKTSAENLSVSKDAKKKRPVAVILLAIIVLSIVVISGSLCGYVALTLVIMNKKPETTTTIDNETLSRIENLETLFQQVPNEADFLDADNSPSIAALQNDTQNTKEILLEFLEFARKNALKLNALQNQTQDIEEMVEEFFEHSGNQTQRLNELQNKTLQVIDSLERQGQHRSFPTSSCVALSPFSPSGYYWVRASNGSAVRVYCDTTRSCGGVTGGWMRVAELDMANSSQQCPSGLRQRTDSNIRTCVRNTDQPGCSAVQYPTANVQYSRVCGKVIGYQIGTTDAFRGFTRSISSPYVDGVSLTHGDPREHIWTFAAADSENGAHEHSSCLCIISRVGHNPPTFVGTDYFCDTGIPTYDTANPPGFLGADPLWDGDGCEPPNNCCSFNTPPWFYKQLRQPTTDNIEMRVCRDEAADNDDIAIETIELYIQ